MTNPTPQNGKTFQVVASKPFFQMTGFVKDIGVGAPIETGYVGEFKGEKLYCNEKTRNNKGFLFKCGKGCEHDTTGH